MATRIASVPNETIFNAVRAYMSKDFQDRIPAATKDNMLQVGLTITSNNFKAQFNEWLDALINRIGMTIFHDYTIQNRLSKYIYGEMEYGEAIQEIATDIVKGREMDYGEDGKSVDPFIKVSPDVKAMYHVMNKPIQYCTSIEKDRARRAFLTPGGLYRLIGMFVNKLYSSANYDTWLLTKSTMAYYLNNGMATEGAPLLPTQVVSVVDVVDKATAETFLLSIKNALSSLKFPNNAFNPMQIHKTLDDRNMTLFIRSDILNAIGVKAMANAFHIDELSLNVSIEEMDDFGVDPAGNKTENVSAVLAEDGWLLITQQFDDLDTQYNARGRYWNYFLTRAMSFGVSYFKDCIIFQKAA